MKRVLCVLMLTGALAIACAGDEDVTGPEATPTGERGGILEPIDRTRDVVDQLDERQGAD